MTVYYDDVYDAYQAAAKSPEPFMTAMKTEMDKLIAKALAEQASRHALEKEAAVKEALVRGDRDWAAAEALIATLRNEIKDEYLRSAQAVEMERKNWEAYREGERKRVEAAVREAREEYMPGPVRQYMREQREKATASPVSESGKPYRMCSQCKTAHCRYPRVVCDECHQAMSKLPEAFLEACTRGVEEGLAKRPPIEFSGIRVGILEGHNNEFVYLAGFWGSK